MKQSYLLYSIRNSIVICNKSDTRDRTTQYTHALRLVQEEWVTVVHHDSNLSAISRLQQVTFKWEHNDVCYRLDRQCVIYFSACSLTLQFTDRRVAPL